MTTAEAPGPTLDERYREALAQRVAGGDEEPLLSAFEIGRALVARGVGLMELVGLHTRALVYLLGHTHDEELARTIVASGSIFAEALAPFEMVLLGFREKSEALERLAASLEARVAERTRALEAAERRHRELIEHSPAILYARRLSSPERFEYVSPRIERLLGVDADGFSPHDLEEHVHPGDRATLDDALAGVRARGTPLSVEYRLCTGAGQTLSVRDLGQVVVEEGQAPLLHGVITDVTEEVGLREQAQQRQRLEALGRLAGGVAHDFNNLLHVIASFTRFVLDELPDGDRHAADLREVLKAAANASSLTSQLLAFARRGARELRVVDVNHAVARLDKIMRATLGEGVSLAVVLGDGVWPVQVDPTHLDQIVVTLLVNARDALPEGGAVEVSTRNVTLGERAADLPSGEYVELSVTDTGIGMAPQTRARVFEPFFTTKGASGTGLGLSTSIGIAQQAGGSIRVESEEGRGATFRVLLPRVTRDDERTPAVALEQEATAARARHVLVVEDQAPVLRMVRRVLERAGYRVSGAVTAEEGLALYKASEPGAIDAVLSDVALPGMSGARLLKELRQLAPDAKVVLMSGYVGDRAGDLDGVPFLPKPFTPEELLARIREVLTG